MDATLTEPGRITGPVPETRTSKAHVLEPYAVDLLPVFDYVQEEYFVSGRAGGAGYTTRLLVRRPAHDEVFSGTVLAEVSHIWGGTSVWRAYHRQVMRGGHAWVEIDSQTPSAIGLVRASDPQRYANLDMVGDELAHDFGSTIPFEENPTPETLANQYDLFKERWWKATPQSMEIIAQVAAAVREGGVGLTPVRTVLLGGISQTGGVVRRFVTTHHPTLRRADGGPLFDGYLPAASGGDSLPDIDVPVMEILGEAEFPAVRWPCGVSGQVRGTAHRRDDSDTFRLYEVAGMAHRETRYMSERDKTRLRDCPLPRGGRWSTFANSHLYHAFLEIMIAWVQDGVEPPPSRTIDLTDDLDIVRDDIGNAVGGLRTTFTDAPRSRLIAATPVGRPSWYHGSEVPLSADDLRRRYGTVEHYHRRHAGVLSTMLGERFVLEADADELRREVQDVRF